MSVFNKSSDRDEAGRLLRGYRKPKHPMSTPSRWIRGHMTKPRRNENNKLCRQIVAGKDPDALAWPLGSRKPHYYYW
jgi:hypothetical protein